MDRSKPYLPPLGNLQAFEASGRLGSFAKAAEELNVTPSAVSHRISTLEDLLGEKLFEPSGRGVRLTESGHTYFISIQRLFDGLTSATDRLRRKGVEGLFTIRMHPAVANRWFIPVLARFAHAYPLIELNIVTTDVPFDFSSPDTDVVVDYTDYKKPGFHYDLLSGDAVIVVCSPDYVEKSGLPLESVQDLIQHQLIHSQMRPDEWSHWFEALGAAPQQGLRRVLVTNRDAAIEAAAAGLGVALAHPPLVNDLLRRERIVSPLNARVPTAFSFFLVTTPERALLPRVAAFRDWLVSERNSLI